jgi:hypothetical protein
MFLSIDGGRSRIYSSDTSQGAHRRHFLALIGGALPDLQLRHLTGSSLSMFFYVDGGCSRIFVSTFQGARCRCFLALMVGAPGSTAPAPPREPTVDIFYVGGGCSWISVSTFQGAHHRCFLALMVDTPRCIALAPPRGPAIDVS